MLRKFIKFLAIIIGQKIPFFKGQDRLVRLLYSPNKFKNLHKGEKFVSNYFGLNYEGITSNYIDWGVYFKGGHEKGLVNFFKKHISMVDYFIDIGSNSGTVSLPFLNEKNIKIICFEPLQYNYKKLINNFKINNGLEKHSFHNIALSNKITFVKIFYSETDENPGFASIDNFYNLKNLKEEEVKTNSLDNMYNFRNKKIIIKIDVEGYEDRVINGAINILKENQVIMYMEAKNGKIPNILIEAGFKYKYFNFRGDKIYFLKNGKSNDIILTNY